MDSIIRKFESDMLLTVTPEVLTNLEIHENELKSLMELQ